MTEEEIKKAEERLIKEANRKSAVERHEYERKEYEEDRKRVESLHMEDHYTCTDIDAMEDIARKVPLSQINRPLWDKELLEDLACSKVVIEEDVWKKVWSREERANYYSTPMFLVEGEK